MSRVVIRCRRGRSDACTHPHGFTLLELLVVIGLISLLISILLPMVTRAREHARIVLCAYNMRQIFTSLSLYAGSNHDHLPVMLADAGKRYGFVGIELDDYGVYSFKDGAIWPYAVGGEYARQVMFLCPSDAPPRFTGGQGQIQFLRNEHRNLSYNFNDNLASDLDGKGLGIRFAQVRGPSHKNLIFEQEAPSHPFGDVAVAMGPTVHTRRHLGRCNLGFFDGHVELFNPSVFVTGNL